MNKALRKIESMSDADLQTTWSALAHDPLQGMWDEMTSMTEWAQYVYSEMSHRGLKAT
jgi:hypothetical protein